MLTVKQEAFCLAYAKSGNATQSYKDAGYKYASDVIARVESSKLLAKPNIQKRLSEIAAETHTKAIADISEVQSFFTSVMRGEVVETVTTPSGKVVETPSRTSDRLYAADKLAKMMAGYDNSVRVEGDMELSIKVNYGD